MMIVKSPLKEKSTKPNRRKTPPSQKNGSETTAKRFTTPGNTNGTVYGKRKKRSKKRIPLSDVAAWKVILGAVIIGVLGIFYLNHVFATQELLREVHQLERSYNKAKLRHDDYRLTYDRMIGPKEIYEKAKKLGFINGGPADKVITIEVD